jgi:cobalamin-dependent methionine synthase I
MPSNVYCRSLASLSHPSESLAAGQWFSPGTMVSSTNKTDHHDITDILLKIVLNTNPQPYYMHAVSKHL